jgi:hypothetical protein
MQLGTIMRVSIIPHVFLAAALCSPRLSMVLSAGSVINVAADFYKAGAKASGAGLVTSGPYRLAIRLNYFGEF